MKSTGIIRKIDELGRIVIPKEVRNVLRINSGDDLEILVENNNIVLKKYSTMLNMKEYTSKIISYLEEYIKGKVYITDKEKVISEGDLYNTSLPKNFTYLLNERKAYKSNNKEVITFDMINKTGYFIVSPIINNSNPLGLIILISENSESENNLFIVNVIKKLIENAQIL